MQKGRYISKMFLKGDSVILVIKMQEEDDAASDVVGPKGAPRVGNARAEMNPLDEGRVETHMLCPDHRLLQDPGDGPKAVKTPKDFVDSIGYEDATAFQDQMLMATTEGTRSMKSQIDGMHSKVDKMEPNVTTTVQQNIFIQKDIWGYLTSTSTRKQTQNNKDKSMEDKLVLTNKGTPVQQGSNRSADEETKIRLLDTNERLIA